MESISFRCQSCATPLKARADQAGRTARCKKCGAAIRIPARAQPKPEVEEFVITEAATEDEPAAQQPAAQQPAAPQQEKSYEAAEPAPRRKRPDREKRRGRAAGLRAARAWKKVRLGLILIVVAMWANIVLGLLLLIVGWIFPEIAFRIQAIVPYPVELVALAGNVLCVFVPIKGGPRALALATLGLIAFGLALTITSGWMYARTMAEVRGVEKKIQDDANERQKTFLEEAQLRGKAAAGNKEAAKRLEELSKKRSRQEALPDFQSALSIVSRSLFWLQIQAHCVALQMCLQVVLSSFFIRAIGRALENKDLMAICPRMALSGVVSLVLFLGAILTVSHGGMTLASFGGLILIFFAFYILGLVSIVWAGLMYFEACSTIENYVKRECN
jgi:hypothetical protein